jgi:hypothetical protein
MDRYGVRGQIEEVGMRTPVIATTETIETIERPDELQEPTCRHHWVIESPHGATSMGRCKICDEVKEFRNSAADTLWEGDPMSSAGKMSGGANRPVVAAATKSGPAED